MKEKPWYERKIIVGMWIFIFILIIIGFISSLSDNKKEREKMSLNGKKLVDGKGIERVSKIVREVVKNGNLTN